MKISLVDYNPVAAELLRNIKWKELNTEFKNDFIKTQNYIFENYIVTDDQRKSLKREAQIVLRQLAQLRLSRLSEWLRPPQETVVMIGINASLDA